ncbi:hypothetical protein ACXZ1M_05780 [Duganella sp. PWIR1]
MKNPCWRAVVTALEYAIQFSPEPDSAQERLRLFNIVWYRNIYPFSVDDTRRALAFLERQKDIDISGLLPQPHSNQTLRRVFAQLNQTLSKLPA